MLGGLVKSLAPKLLGGLGGILGGGGGGLLGGLGKMLGGGGIGNVFGVLNQAMNAFKGIMGGGGQNPLSTLGGNNGLFPQTPASSASPSALNNAVGSGMQGVQNLMNQSGLSSEHKAAMNEQGKKMQEDMNFMKAMQDMERMFQKLTTIMKKTHEISMNILRNI